MKLLARLIDHPVWKGWPLELRDFLAHADAWRRRSDRWDIGLRLLREGASCAAARLADVTASVKLVPPGLDGGERSTDQARPSQRSPWEPWLLYL